MGESELPGLTPERVIALEGTWDDGGLWDDVMWLSRMCWQEGTPEQAALRWHHLVLAVANFKRQAGRISPPSIGHLLGSGAAPRDEFIVPSGHSRSAPLVLSRDAKESWQTLLGIHGVALATATTLLAALWPKDHFIFDFRVQEAADALRIQADLLPTRKTQQQIKTGRRQRPSFEDYATVRAWLMTIDCPLRSSERALYRLSQEVKPVPGRSWPDYAKAVSLKLRDF
jgi:hypothetical protein